MKLVFYLLSIVMFLLSVLCDKPPSGCGQTSCPHYYRPVCATNGRIRRTFTNQCAVRTFNECSHEEKFNILRKGHC
ncbi:hypothetical protein PVAND_007389 [Polypedilum vanderplanki]|uniref:Kazal-like domain-containing protein n=1 Tax=Polypedilum vanderplanki TaxID=319348 RepID=A0A9J6C6D3_POLVA|nr:hypothetical protein PVAND_007389 [Polypedilum vanderplanki]